MQAFSSKASGLYANNVLKLFLQTPRLPYLHRFAWIPKPCNPLLHYLKPEPEFDYLILNN